jgi:hypothetical protein
MGVWTSKIGLAWFGTPCGLEVEAHACRCKALTMVMMVVVVCGRARCRHAVRMALDARARMAHVPLTLPRSYRPYTSPLTTVRPLLAWQSSQ